MNQKTLNIIYGIVIVILIGTVVYFAVGKKSEPVAQKPSPTPTQVTNTPKSNPTPTPTPADPTANWKTYTYKNVSFKYPQNWSVVFDSTVAGQPNGFDLHVLRTGDGGYEPDALYLSTYNSRSGTSSDYNLNVNRIFSQNQNSADFIKFVVNGTTIYAGCGYYSKGQATLDICNKIAPTVVIK